MFLSLTVFVYNVNSLSESNLSNIEINKTKQVDNDATYKTYLTSEQSSKPR